MINIEEQFKEYLHQQVESFAGDSDSPHQIEFRIMKLGAFTEFEVRAYDRIYGSQTGQTIQEAIGKIEKSKSTVAQAKRTRAAELIEEAEKLESQAAGI